ncbi:hypothetical protein [Akkermansia biwaensis]
MPRLADRVGRNSLCLHKPGSPFGNGTAYSSIFHVNLQRNRFMIVKRSTGMYADPLFVLHPVRNKRTSRIPGILSFKSFFPGRIFLSPGKFFNTFPALEKNAKFPRLQCNELRKQFLFRKRLFVKIIPRFALLRFPGRGGQRRAQCHVETDPGKFFPFLHPDTSQYSQRILSRCPGKSQFFKRLRMIQQPFHEFPVLQFMKDISPLLPDQRKEMGHMASLRQFRVLQQGFQGKRFFRLQFLLNIFPAQPGNTPHISTLHLPCQTLKR